MDARLCIEDLTAGYLGAAVLAGVSLAVGAGEVVGLIGPNGAGKSTLMRTISRTLPAQAGAVRLDGRPLNEWAPRDLARELAVMATQELPQAVNLSVRDYVGLGRTPHQDWFGASSAADLAATETAIRQVDLLALADRPFMAISAGERQRAQLARALAQSPKLLLLDEPTAHLDIGHQQTLLGLLRQIAGQGVTVLIAIHDLNLAAAACDRLILLHDGHVLAEGTPAEVLTQERLARAYGHPWMIRRHPMTGRPFVFPADVAPPSTGAPLIHLVGGGGALAGLAGGLQALGYRLQAGVLHTGDSDVQLVQDLGIPCLVAPSFAPVDAVWQAALRDWLAHADAVIVADVPFGPGNIGNLQVLRQTTGIPLLGVSALSWTERDFADGAVATLGAGLPISLTPTLDTLLRNLTPTAPGTWPIPRTV